MQNYDEWKLDNPYDKGGEKECSTCGEIGEDDGTHVCEHKNEDWKYDESGVDMYCTKCKDSEVELCDNPNCEDGIVDYDYYKNPIYCQVCDKHN